MDSKNLIVIVLAAGEGKRMKSDIPKVMHPLCGKPMINILLQQLNTLNFDDIYTVVGHKREILINHLKQTFPDMKFVHQIEQRGSGDAVMACKDAFKKFDGNILIIAGDMPLIKGETLKEFTDAFNEQNLDIAVLSAFLDNPYGYGRVVRDGGDFTKIVEERDAADTQKSIKEVNSGIYCVRAEHLFRLLDKIDNFNAQGEFYLTDIIQIGKSEGLKVQALSFGESDQFFGINNREQLASAEKILVARKISKLQSEGVTFINPDTTYIELDVNIGKDTVVYPNNHILGNTKIGQMCNIGGFNTIKDSTISDNVFIKGYCYIDRAAIDRDSQVGPFTHIRPETIIGEDCKVGNFVEIKKSVLKNGVKASHLSYIGDADIMEGVNVGAGTITCNYDGFRKHKTFIGKNVFIGSDTQLVAPVSVGDDTLIAAGTTVTKDIPPNSLVHSRVKQVNLSNMGMKNRK